MRLRTWLGLVSRGYCFRHREFPPTEYGGLFDFTDGHPGTCRKCWNERVDESWEREKSRMREEESIREKLLNDI